MDIMFRVEFPDSMHPPMVPPGPARGSSIMGGLLTDFVTIGKAHGATIDHLALGTLALHWAQAAGKMKDPITFHFSLQNLPRKLPQS